jgi:ATP/ADP translocase
MYAVSDGRYVYPVASLYELIITQLLFWCDAVTLKMRLPAASNYSPFTQHSAISITLRL